jgi:hypothetical protein
MSPSRTFRLPWFSCLAGAALLGACAPEGLEVPEASNPDTVKESPSTPATIRQPQELGLTVSIVAGPDVQSSRVTASGTLMHLVTDRERATFGIGDAALKNAIGSFMGRNPDDLYVRGPTPWGDLYTTYGLEETKAILTVKSAQILDITSQPTVLNRVEFINDGNQFPVIYNVGATQEVAHTVETNWSSTHGVDFNQTISYEVGFLGTGGGGQTSLSYSYQWGQGGSESYSYTTGTSQGATVEVPPQGAVEAVLSASRGTMRVRIRYNVSLQGMVAANYYPRHQDHHFWFWNLADVMAYAGISNSREYVEDIEIGYFANARVVIRDIEKVEQIYFSYGQSVPGGHCLSLNEPADPDTWGDNSLCTPIDYGFKFSASGPIAGMRCTLMNEPADPHGWNDNYFCVPQQSRLTPIWSYWGPVANKHCINIAEPSDPYGWNDNYLCF